MSNGRPPRHLRLVETIDLPEESAALYYSAVCEICSELMVGNHFHISPRQATGHVDQLPDDDPGADLFDTPTPHDGSDPW